MTTRASLPGKSTPWQLGGQDADVGLDDAGTAKHPGVGEQRRADPGGRVSLIALIALRQSIGGPDAADPTTLWGASPPTTDQKG